MSVLLFWQSAGAPTTRRAQVSWAEFEVPNAPRRGVVGWAELEVPNAPRRGVVGWAEFEVPNAPAPRRGVLGWAEFEVPNAPRRAVLGWAEFEVPNAPRRGVIGWAEFEVPNAPRRALIGWAEFEVPAAYVGPSAAGALLAPLARDAQQRRPPDWSWLNFAQAEALMKQGRLGVEDGFREALEEAFKPDEINTDETGFEEDEDLFGKPKKRKRRSER